MTPMQELKERLAKEQEKRDHKIGQLIGNIVWCAFLVLVVVCLFKYLSF